MASWKKMLTTGSSTTDLSDVNNTAADAAGELLIWDNSNSKFVPNTLTAGTGISVTNGDGSITIANTISDTNLGNSDQTLSADRTVEMSGNAIVFDNSSTEVARIFSSGYIRATGRSIVNGNGTIGGQFILNDADSSHSVTLQGPSTVSSNVIFILPDADGTDGQVITTDGSGNLSFSNTTSVYDSTTGAEEYNGDTVNFGSGPSGLNANIEQGKLYYLDSSQQWEEADADAESTASGMLAIATSNASTEFLVKGIARHTSWGGFTTGDVLYLSTTSGEITNTAPSVAGDIVRVVGYCTNGTTREIFFDPDKTWIEL